MKKSVVLSLHLLYWFAYLLFIFIFFQSLPSEQRHTGFRFPGWMFISTFLSSAMIPALIGFYTYHTLLFNRFLQRKRIAALFLSGTAVSMGAVLLEDIYLSVFRGPGLFQDGWNSAIGISILLFLVATLHGILGLIMKGFISFYGDIKLKEELNKKNFDTELALIKSQINPHFLFNTINNIDVLIGSDPARASAYLNKLSDIMRFMLYETKTSEIPLATELSYIEKYLDLQKIRSSNPSYVNYAVEGDPASWNLAPMLFIPYIENAFKHAENKKAEEAVSIKIQISQAKISFICSNHSSPRHSENPGVSGIGNELIRRRLELLYPHSHTLELSNTGARYTVILTLTR
jgi:two-component system LytT family sensor kinase